MLQDKARRGRPKGSGIDDTTRLETIAELLAADPTLKPTTAIKSIGITDPSAIRRLRDKFHEFSAAQRKEMGAAETVVPLPALSAPETPTEKSTRPRALSAAGPAAARKVAAAAPTIAQPEPAAARQPVVNLAAVPQPPSPPAAPPIAGAPASLLPKDPAALLMMCTGLGIRFASAAIEAQFTLGAQLMRSPPLALAIRNQIAFNEMIMSLLVPPGARPVKAR